MRFIDSHCHLDHEKFAADLDGVLKRAADVGIDRILCIGTGDGPPELDRAIRLAERHPQIVATVGVHPHEAAKATPGAKGLRFYPFGNGVERIFNNKPAISGIQNLNFNIHQSPELVRAACEGIVFAMNYGFDIMKEVGAGGGVVRAGKANLFLSPVFREIFANTTQTTVELYNTAGADGAARGAAYGFGFYKSIDEAFSSLECLETIVPSAALSNQYSEIYQQWKQHINIENKEHEYNKTSLL